MQANRGFDLGDWHFGSVIPEGYESRLACGWNMGGSRLYHYAAARTRLASPRWRDRPIELNRRFQIPDPARVPKWEWYQEYRRFVGLFISEACASIGQTGHTPLPAKAILEGDAAEQDRVQPLRSWGEVCFREL